MTTEKQQEGKRVTIKCYATINEGEINFGRLVEEKLFGRCNYCGHNIKEVKK